MNDDNKELLKIGMEVALRPVTEVAENAIGLLGGDWLSERRARNRAKLKDKTNETLKNRKVENAEEPSPSIVLPLLQYAQDESREELLDLWAKLLAAAADPARRNRYRREFVDIVRQLEPLDAAVLTIIAKDEALQPNRLDYIAMQLKVAPDQVSLSFRNLRRLDLTWEINAGSSTANHPTILALGRQLLALVTD